MTVPALSRIQLKPGRCQWHQRHLACRISLLTGQHWVVTDGNWTGHCSDSHWELLGELAACLCELPVHPQLAVRGCVNISTKMFLIMAPWFWGSQLCQESSPVLVLSLTQGQFYSENVWMLTDLMSSDHKHTGRCEETTRKDTNTAALSHFLFPWVMQWQCYKTNERKRCRAHVQHVLLGHQNRLRAEEGMEGWELLLSPGEVCSHQAQDNSCSVTPHGDGHPAVFHTSPMPSLTSHHSHGRTFLQGSLEGLEPEDFLQCSPDPALQARGSLPAHPKDAAKGDRNLS